jgi:phosphoglycolate phosphatase
MSQVLAGLPRAILFDLDGTLIDSAPDLAAAADQLRLIRGMSSLPYEHYRRVAGSGARGLIGVAFGLKPGDDGFDELKEEFFQNYQQALTERTYVFDGVVELIEQLQLLGLQWGVVTNKSERFTLPITRAIGLFEGAKAIVSGDTTPFAKPHPQPLLEAALQMNLPPEQCWYVGDDERDMVAGRAAKMRTIAATYGYLGDQPVTDWPADHHIHHPIELLKFLKPA